VAVRCVFSSSKYTKTRFLPGLRHEPRWGSLRCSPDFLVGWGGRHPLSITFPSTPSASRSRRLCYQAPITNYWLRLCQRPRDETLSGGVNLALMPIAIGVFPAMHSGLAFLDNYLYIIYTAVYNHTRGIDINHASTPNIDNNYLCVVTEPGF